MSWLSDNAALLGLAGLDGLSAAAAIFMVAIGLNLVYGVLRVLNVAHGSFFAIGGYAAASLTTAALANGLPAWTSLPLLVVSAALVGCLLGPPIERLLRRTRDHEPVLQLLVTFAVFMILEDLQKLVWGVQPITSDAPLRLLGTVDIPFGSDTIPFNAYQLVLMPGTAAVILLALVISLRQSLFGRMLMAVATDREAAETVGIDVARVSLAAFVLGTALAALGGALVSPTTSLVPGTGAQTIVLSFAVVASAGLGQVEGAAVTATLIGLCHSFAIYFAPEFEVVVPYVVMVAVLAVRPEGLFGVLESRRV